MYASQADIEARLDPKHLIELADDDGDGTADSAVIEAAIADADALIDTHLGGRYVLPLESVPSVLRKLSADLAIGSLFARRRESASPQHEARARAAADLLAAIARGEILLAQAAETPLKAAPDSTTRGDDKTFSKESLDTY
jgi:phage gp36-like protein